MTTTADSVLRQTVDDASDQDKDNVVSLPQFHAPQMDFHMSNVSIVVRTCGGARDVGALYRENSIEVHPKLRTCKPDLVYTCLHAMHTG